MRLVHVALDNSYQIYDNKRGPCAQTCHITNTVSVICPRLIIVELVRVISLKMLLP